MIEFLPNERWKEFDLGYDAKFRYAVSNCGRLMSFVGKMKEGNLLKGAQIEGYPVLSYAYKVDGRKVYKKVFIHKLVAENFLKKKSDDQIFVLHLNHCRSNNTVSNLRWATREEMLEYNSKSPYVIESRRKLVEYNRKLDGQKLSSTIVMRIKKMIFNPKRRTRMKIIAKQFGISKMQLYRIKSGENWGHIIVDEMKK